MSKRELYFIDSSYHAPISGFVIGFGLALLGYPVTTWEFWAALLVFLIIYLTKPSYALTKE